MHRVKAQLVLAVLAGGAAAAPVSRAQSNDDDRRRSKLAAIAEHDETVMVPMRDGIRLATDIYRPRDRDGKLPTVFWRTPYNFHRLRGTQLETALAFVERGYAFVAYLSMRQI